MGTPKANGKQSTNGRGTDFISQSRFALITDHCALESGIPARFVPLSLIHHSSFIILYFKAAFTNYDYVSFGVHFNTLCIDKSTAAWYNL